MREFAKFLWREILSPAVTFAATIAVLEILKATVGSAIAMTVAGVGAGVLIWFVWMIFKSEEDDRG